MEFVFDANLHNPLVRWDIAAGECRLSEEQKAQVRRLLGDPHGLLSEISSLFEKDGFISLNANGQLVSVPFVSIYKQGEHEKRVTTYLSGYKTDEGVGTFFNILIEANGGLVPMCAINPSGITCYLPNGTSYPGGLEVLNNIRGMILAVGGCYN